ncbi:general stress protein [Actinoplanes sp. NPDC051851]|uniref:general stress protein n=1 Tax=Actinoplanes sp. NPDC051851 TaxID=3154753 RepID=UPI0034497C8E
MTTPTDPTPRHAVASTEPAAFPAEPPAQPETIAPPKTVAPPETVAHPETPADDPAAAGPATTGAVPPGPSGLSPRFPSQTGGATGHTGPTVVVGTYPEYALAQQAVDHLSDNKFPVEHTSIIGTDLRLGETVLGRLTTGRAAGAGAASGAWFGLFIGVLFGLFSNSNWFSVILTTVLIGAVWGAIFGAIAHAATGGRRDFTSRSSLQAAQYAVLADAEVADEARTLLVQLNWRASGAE